MISHVINSLRDFIFPPLCLHCQELTDRTLLCRACSELLQILPLEGRCAYCFVPSESVCDKCRQRIPSFKKAAAVFDHLGPAAALIHALKYNNRPDLAKDFAAFMIVQFTRLNWPIPDLIVPVPQSLSHYVMRGYNQSTLIANEFAKLLECPCLDLLKRHSGTFSQMGQNRDQRESLSEDNFSWKKSHLISDKTILLIDDVMTTGTTLRHCASMLQQGFPEAIYALSFCLA